ncbi:hypothetical protein Tco_0037305, partial [Tanacetum coccineum]
IIMAQQQQQAADVHQDDLCPPNKRYDLMDANKKVDLENVQCKDWKDKKKQKRSKTDKKRGKDKESRTRVRNQPEITAGSARHSNKRSQRSKE